MPRLRQVPRSEAPPEVLPAYIRMFGDRDPVAEPGTSTGTPGNWWTVISLVPEVLTYFQAGGALYKGKNRVIPPYFVELGIVRTGFSVGSKFVYSQHCKGARAAGISEAKVAAIPHWSATDVRRAPGAFLRRGDPRAHVHRRAVHDVRGFHAFATAGVRRCR
jgi:alkylhydroperoxidase family enzyme